MKRIIAAALAAIASLTLAGVILAHHAVPADCGQFTVESQVGFTATLTHGEVVREFGPFGPGEWPTTYGPFSIEPGTWDVQFYGPNGDKDASGVVVVEACPEPSPTPTPRPTPSVGTPPPATPTPRPPTRTLPPTDT